MPFSFYRITDTIGSYYFHTNYSMGLRLSQIFRVLLIITALHYTFSNTYQQQDESKYQRLSYPNDNYLIGLYPIPPYNASCSCDDAYENYICGPSYGDGCEIKIFGRPNCTAQPLCINGCFCDNRRGWYRHPMSLKCVKYAECPKYFNYWNCPGKYEVYRLGDDSCKDSCDFHTGVVNCQTEQCVPGCFCKKGYARSKKDNNQCVPIFDCGTANYNEVSEYA